MKIFLLFILLVQIALADNAYYYKNNKQTALTILWSDSNTDYYENENGTVLGVRNKIIIKLKNSDNLEKYINEFKLNLEKTLGENLYLLSVKNKNLTIGISNSLNEKEDVEYSHPNFIQKMMRR